MTIEVNGCSVSLMKNEIGQFQVQVQVRSKSKPGLKATNDIDPARAGSQAELTKMVGIAGAAAAEYLCEQYADVLEPSLYVAWAQRAFLEEMKLVASLKEGVRPNIRRLQAIEKPVFDSLYSEADRDYFDRIAAADRRDDVLTALDVAQVNAMIGVLHQNQQDK